MKYYQPRIVALVNSAIITVVYLFFNIVATLLFPPRVSFLLLLVFLVISAGLIFIICYLIIRFTLEKFIYSKIRLIYKSIRSIKTPKGNHKSPAPDQNILESVEKEVSVWESETTKEISQLKRLEQYRKDFLGNVSHELRNPIFTIQGYILTLLDGGLEDPSINREYLKRTENNVERLITIVEDLDAITQLESGEMKLKIVRFDIVSLVREVLESFQIKAEKKKTTFILPDDGKTIPVEADRERIRQVMTNLIDNAIRYRQPVGDCQIKISFFDMDEAMLVEVTDNGIGIEQQDIPRLFERFYRTEQGRMASKKGRGLGLAIVKHLIEGHHQTINVRSTVGVGTTFGFTLKKPA